MPIRDDATPRTRCDMLNKFLSTSITPWRLDELTVPTEKRVRTAARRVA
jgi:hypothetical protein